MPSGFITTGAFLNAFGILLGALFGLARRKPISLRAQNFFKAALGAFTVFLGLRLVWNSTGGTFGAVLKQLFLAGVSVMAGHLLGKILGLQKISNRLGRHASSRLAAAQNHPPAGGANGFFAATILFCAAPLGLVGAVTDGWSDYFYLLALKAAMDGLAMTSFIKMFRWPVALSAVPVLVFLDALTLAARFGARPWLEAHALTDAVNAAAGLIVCAMALVILEVRRVDLANYLPALAIAPLLTWWLR